MLNSGVNGRIRLLVSLTAMAVTLGYSPPPIYADGPGIMLLPPFNDFGSVPVGNSSTDQTFTVTNSGNATLHVGTTSIGGTDASQFVKGTDGCSGASVAVAGTCTIKVHFSPTSSGSKTALLTIPSDAASSPDYAELDGTGTVGPGILLLPPFNDFGSVPVGNSSTDQTFTVTNSGSATLHVGTTSIGGTDASQFVKGTDGCSGASVAVAGTCTIKVHFSPTSSGSKTALLTIPSDAASSPDYAELDGTGTVGPGILLLPPFNDFGSVPVGNSSTDQTFTVTNSGNATLHVGTTSIGGTDASQFVKGTDGCSGASVAVAGTCTIKVHFSPTSSGSKTALLTIPSDAASSPDYAELDGTGTVGPGHPAAAAVQRLRQRSSWQQLDRPDLHRHQLGQRHGSMSGRRASAALTLAVR